MFSPRSPRASFLSESFLKNFWNHSSIGGEYLRGGGTCKRMIGWQYREARRAHLISRDVGAESASGAFWSPLLLRERVRVRGKSYSASARGRTRTTRDTWPEASSGRRPRQLRLRGA